MTLYITSNITFSSDDDCPLTVPEFPAVSGDIQVDLALTRIRCAAYLAHKDNFIDKAFHTALEQLNITFHNRT